MSTQSRVVLVAGLMVVCLFVWRLQTSRTIPSDSESQAGRPSKGTQAVVNAPSVQDPLDTNREVGTGGTPPARATMILVDSNADYSERLQATVSLPIGGLGNADREALYAWLRKPEAGDGDQRGQVLKNQVMDRLCEMEQLPDGLGELLVEVYRDIRQDEVVRDYAVQHLAEYYEQRFARGAGGSNAGDLQKVREVLWEALNDTESSIAGTALLALLRLSERREEFDSSKIKTAALEMATSAGTGQLARITAFQVCGRMGAAEAIPVLLQAARESQEMPLRISAVGALGLVGGAEVREYLNTLVDGNEERLKLPARRALFQMDKNSNSARTSGGTR